MAAVFTGLLGAQCHAIPERSKLTLPWSASEGSLHFASDVADCKVDTKGVDWVGYEVVPPGTAFMGSTLKVWVKLNPGADPREGKIRLGDADITIAQDGGLPPMSFSPARLALSAKVGDATAITKTIFIGSSTAFEVSVKTDNTAWLSVTPESLKEGPQKQHRFVVTVRPDKLRPGDHQAAILLQSSGVSNSQESIPVILQIIPESLDGK